MGQVRKYDYIDWSRYIKERKTIRHVQRVTGINFTSCRDYLIRHGWKPLKKEKYRTMQSQKQNNHWNVPRKNTPIKYLNGANNIDPNKKRGGLPRILKKHMETL